MMKDVLCGIVGVFLVCVAPAATANVCPYDHDRDRDGVRDKDDQCPATPLMVPVDKAGCSPVVVVDGDALLVGRRITFRVNSDVLSPPRQSPLDRLAAQLQTRPKAGWVVEVDVGLIGSAERARGLSQARAEAVKQALVERGVVAEHLTARGFGNQRIMNRSIACCSPARGTTVRVVEDKRPAKR